MRNYFNELYAKDSSKKVRIVKRAHGRAALNDAVLQEQEAHPTPGIGANSSREYP